MMAVRADRAAGCIEAAGISQVAGSRKRRCGRCCFRPQSAAEAFTAAPSVAYRASRRRRLRRHTGCGGKYNVLQLRARPFCLGDTLFPIHFLMLTAIPLWLLRAARLERAGRCVRRAVRSFRFPCGSGCRNRCRSCCGTVEVPARVAAYALAVLEAICCARSRFPSAPRWNRSGRRCSP